MTVALTEHLLGFDARYEPSTIMATWDSSRRAQYLLCHVSETVLTTDSAQWLSVFDRQVLKVHDSNVENCFDFEPRIAVPNWIGANTGLWENLAALRVHLELNSGSIPEPHWLIAVTWHHDEAAPDLRDVGPYEFPTEPQSREPQWKLLGYDVSDGSLLSGLSNCGYSSEESSVLGPEWSGALNDYHLFDNVETAYAFARITDKRVPEHAPFFVYGLWVIETKTP